MPLDLFRFLLHRPGLEPIVIEAVDRLRRMFECPVDLRLYLCPESGEVTLWACVHTSLPGDEARARLDRFDEEWFLDQLERVDGAFNVELVY